MRAPKDAPASEIHYHSGWLIPAGLGLVILALCGLFLLYDLRPGTGILRGNAPTTNAKPVQLSVRGVKFEVPGNYVETRASRRGGDMDVLGMSALLPDMRGYSAPDAEQFVSNAADSPLVHMVLRGDTNGLTPADRLARVYMPSIADAKGEAGDFGLTHYSFRPGTGYERGDLYVGNSDAGPLLLLCERPAQDLPSPNCLAIDRPVAKGVNLSYRFKRSHLGRWRDISLGVDKLVTGFMKP